jgi:CubicO group peptidase (beta-lactamase class C family)
VLHKVAAALAIALVVVAASGKEYKGTITRVDVQTKTVTLTKDEKDTVFAFTDQSAFLKDGKAVPHEFLRKVAEKAAKNGVPATVTTEEKGGKEVEEGGNPVATKFVFPPFIRLSQDDAKTRQAIELRLAYHKVPGLGITIINGGKIESARSYGVLQAGSDEAVTERTLFQAASLSKPVTALAALRWVQQGKLSLDADVNDQLRSWKVPDSEFTRQTHPTVRQILSHTAGFNLPGFPGYAADKPVPDLLEVLNGRPPANSAAVRVVHTPGTKYGYSGGGYCVLQQLLMDVGRTSFPLLMQETVFKPVGMKDSTFDVSVVFDGHLPVAAGHESNGQPVAGKWRVFPQMAAQGLWTTPSDVARYVIALLQARQGSPDAVLGPDLTRAMFTLQLGDKGLGVSLDGSGRSFTFWHSGGNTGYRCRFVGIPATGQGVVLMTNSGNGGPLIDEFLQDLRTEYDWPN